MKIVHLIDSNNRHDIAMFLDRLQGIEGEHSVMEVGSRKFITHRFEADIIISHLFISWMRLPFLISLRNRHPEARLMHIEHTYSEGFILNNYKSYGQLFNLLRIAYSLFNRVVAISKGQGKWLLSCSLAPVSRLVIIPKAADSRHINHRPREFTQKEPLRILYAGEGDYGSGFDILLEAFASVEDEGVSLTLAAQSAIPERYRKLPELDKRITMIPEADFGDELFADADIVALPSRWQVNNDIAHLAWAAGCVVISSGVDGLEEQSISSALIFGTDVKSWKYGLENLRSLPLDEFATEGHMRVAEEQRIFQRRWRSLLSAPANQLITEETIREALRA